MYWCAMAGGSVAAQPPGRRALLRLQRLLYGVKWNGTAAPEFQRLTNVARMMKSLPVALGGGPGQSCPRSSARPVFFVEMPLVLPALVVAVLVLAAGLNVPGRLSTSQR